MEATQIKQLNQQELLDMVREWSTNDVDPNAVVAEIIQCCGERPYYVDLDEKAWEDPILSEIKTWLEQDATAGAYYSDTAIGMYFFMKFSDALQCYLKFYERSETFWY